MGWRDRKPVRGIVEEVSESSRAEPLLRSLCGSFQHTATGTEQRKET